MGTTVVSCCCWQWETLPLFSLDSVVGFTGYLDMGPCTTPTRGGPLKAAMLMKDAGLGCNFPGHSGQAQDRRPVGHQGPGGGSGGPGTRRVRPLLQMGLPEDPASVEFLCQHSSCINKHNSYLELFTQFNTYFYLHI